MAGTSNMASLQTQPLFDGVSSTRMRLVPGPGQLPIWLNTVVGQSAGGERRRARSGASCGAAWGTPLVMPMNACGVRHVTHGELAGMIWSARLSEALGLRRRG